MSDPGSRAECLVRPLWVAVLSLTVVAAAFSACEGTVLHFDIEDVPVFGPFEPVARELDLNIDGIVDFIFTSQETEFEAVTTGENRAIAQGYPPPYMDPGGYLVALAAGFLIGPDPSPHEWLRGDTHDLAIQSCMNIGCTRFGWPDGIHFMGAQFFIEEEIHYGWIRLRNWLGVNGGYILDYAYETEPGVPILAGAVPEPGTFLLAGAGALTLWVRRRRRRC